MAPPDLLLALAVAASAAALLLLHIPPGAEALWIDLPPSGTKCVAEDIQPNVVAVADYAVMLESHHTGLPTVAVKVTSPDGTTIHQNGNATYGQFAFTTSEAGNYLACFWIDGGADDKGSSSGVSLNLDWKIGIAAKDWDTVAKKEKIEGVELELRKLEASVEYVHHKMLYLKAREAGMRTVSEETNARVVWLSVLSLGVCIVVSVLQSWHLQGFFRKKKLI